MAGKSKPSAGANSGRGRSARTGRFVSLSYAKKHPGTTVIEKKK